jgi:hypothetical protein
MKNPRFNNDRSPGSISRLRPQNYPRPRWVQLSKIDHQVLGESTDSETNRIFAIVTPPLAASSGGKTIRGILIFDNHPESLRLLYRERPSPDVDLVAARRAHPVHLMFALLLMLALSIAIFWPLIVRCHSL